MTVAERLKGLLGQAQDGYLSGEEIAKRLGVTRAAVWKAVASLKDDGYEVDAVRGCGYRLRVCGDALSAVGVTGLLGAECAGLDVRVFERVDSTNTRLRAEAAVGAPEGRVLIAAEQTAGRGRRGRSFYSPAGTGLYISVLLRPQGSAEMCVNVTTMAAVSMCEAIEAVCPGVSAGIKWVNDIFVNGRKVCGILTEAAADLETGGMEYVVLGAGVNVYAPCGGFPEDIRTVAGSLFAAPVSEGRNRLAAAFLTRFTHYWRMGGADEYAKEYRARCLVLGRRVNVLLPTGPRVALAEDVDERCRLLVRYDDGSCAALSSGEISIRME